MSSRGPRSRREKIPWAVIGLGHFAQTAILPAFAHARENGELVALVSGDEKKRKQLARRYHAEAASYEELDELLRSGAVQAVYVAVPNHLHREMTVRAAEAGVHVLCEKPMAVTARECREMIAACDANAVKLMVAYRLHLEKANLTAIDEIRHGRIGEPRHFSSTFCYQLDAGNVRTVPTDEGGGPLYDLGTYCINAARYLFRDEPFEVSAVTGSRPGDPRFAHIEEQISAVLRFPGDRLATFTVGFGAAPVNTYTVVGTTGSLTLEPGYSHAAKIELTVKGKRGQRRRSFAPRDQVAAELSYFADCIVRDRQPEPSGTEGLNDVTIIEAILDSAHTGRRISIALAPRRQRPTRAQAIDKKPPPREPTPVHATAPRGG